jgi:DNA-binding CsgD family transcriptional regulator
MERQSRFRSQRALRRPAADAYEQRWMYTIAVQALDQLAMGLIITDSSGTVIQMNLVAELIVEIEDGLLVRNHQLCAKRVFETSKVAKLIAGATGKDKPGMAAGRMLIGRCDGLPAYVLTVTPLHTGLALSAPRFAMLTIIDPARHFPSERDMTEFFGLSPAETRLARALLTGKTLAQAAGASSIRITTARTQLRSILRKVGAKRQSDLVRIMWSTGIGSVSIAAGWLNLALAVTEMPL